LVAIWVATVPAATSRDVAAAAVDVDRFITTNQASWSRLEQLAAAASGPGARLRPPEVDELVQLYQRASAHLSHARTQRADPALVARLTRLVATSGGVIYGTRSRSLAGVARFFAISFPAAVWHARRFALASALLMLVPAVLVGAWLARSDVALEAAAPEALREAYVEEDFEAYYSSAPASEFATAVTVNNIQVGFLAFASGIAACVLTAFILVTNGLNIGQAAGLFAAVGQQPKFYGLILPHGLLEISAIIVAGGAGLAVGWAIIDPGDRSRGEALAEQGRRSAVIALGLALAFVVAGTIEGFVTPSGLPTSMRIAIGATACIAFWTYVVVLGRRAALLGYTGAFGEHERLEKQRARAATEGERRRFKVRHGP
jgi:uncharacterized membrane protein SpoIIM required for sporulation